MNTPTITDTFWLGAHKTGTTFLQKSLELSLPELMAAGIDYLPMEVLRERYTRPLLYDGFGGAPGPAGPGPEGRRRLIFDENIPALVQHALTPDGLYPLIGARAGAVAEHLSMQVPRLVLGVRDFVGFLPSLYCEALKSTPFKPFSHFQRVPTDKLRWSLVVDRLLAAFPGSTLYLYEAEALRGAEQNLLSAVTGLAPDTFTLLGQPEREGFSQAAIETLEAQAETGPVSRADLRAAVRAHPRKNGTPGYSPWKSGEKDALAAIYSDDISRLKARDDIRFLDLSAPGP